MASTGFPGHAHAEVRAHSGEDRGGGALIEPVARTPTGSATPKLSRCTFSRSMCELTPLRISMLASSPREDPVVAGGFCKVDAGHGALEVGDLLTTSPTEGHAMRADSGAPAFGAVIGKAMQALDQGRGLVAVLVALQ
jgi:hypothetical protein